MVLANADSNTGLSPIDWGAWETTLTGTDVSSSSSGPVFTGTNRSATTIDPGGGRRLVTDVETTTRNFATTTTSTVTTTTNQTRQGIQIGVTERFDTTNLGDKIISREIITTMRSRNIEIIAKRLKPSSRIYAFFDNIDMTSYVVPKLIEVVMSSGTFTVGETVVGTLGSKSIRFRLAIQNHKYGPYNSPTESYDNNPYLPGNSLSSLYSPTTTLLNVDTASLELQASSNFYGSVIKNMQLVGQTSGAVATISDLRLVAEETGVFIGSLFIPDPVVS